jgi:hypothetical protein
MRDSRNATLLLLLPLFLPSQMQNPLQHLPHRTPFPRLVTAMPTKLIPMDIPLSAPASVEIRLCLPQRSFRDYVLIEWWSGD